MGSRNVSIQETPDPAGDVIAVLLQRKVSGVEQRELEGLEAARYLHRLDSADRREPALASTAGTARIMQAAAVGLRSESRKSRF